MGYHGILHFFRGCMDLACGGMIGIFLWLTALGYQRYSVARFTIYGMPLLNAVLSSSYSAWVAFL